MITSLLSSMGFEMGGGALFACGFAAAFLIMVVFGRRFINAMRRWQKKGQPIQSDGPSSHFAKAGTPTMGGLLVLISIIVSSVLFMDVHNPVPWISLLALVLFGALGFVDDYGKIKRQSSEDKDALMSAKMRLALGGVFTVLLAYLVNQTMPFYLPEYALAFPGGYVLPLGLLYFVFAYFVIVGTANAANITDGLDGMLSKIYIPILIVMLIALFGATRLGFIPNALLLPEAPGLFPVIGAALGAVVGFLWFNSAPASIFMGDTGSLALGGFIGTIAMLLKAEIVMGVASLMMVVILMSSFIQTVVYKITKKNPAFSKMTFMQVLRYKVGKGNGVGKKVFKMSPLHHHFEAMGMPESKIVERFFIMSILFSGIALLLLRL